VTRENHLAFVLRRNDDSMHSMFFVGPRVVGLFSLGLCRRAPFMARRCPDGSDSPFRLGLMVAGDDEGSHHPFLSTNRNGH